MAKSTRYTIDLSPEFVQVLSNLAEAKQTTKSEIIRRSLMSYQFLESQLKNNGELIIKGENNKETKIVML